MRRGICFALVLILAAAVPAAAKEGAQARLLTSLPLRAKAGSLITIKWTVTVPTNTGQRVPFRANGMFAKLIGGSGATTSATASQFGPPYSVRIRVPRGGIATVKLGLHGWASTPTGTHPAPEYFPITNNPLNPKA